MPQSWYDAMGQLQKITSGSGPGVDLVNSATYNAAGQLLSSMRATAVGVSSSTDLPTSASLGLETFQYNGRNQLTEQTGLGTDINYWYSATANDGRLAQKHNWVTGEEENYTYDSLGRLATAYTTGTQWGLSFVYDGFGNRLQQNVTKGTAPSTVQTVDATTNRLNGAGFGYDSNGNMTGWSTPSGSVTASYDIENRMTQIVTPSVTETYAYGPGNLRVKKYQGGAWTYTVYGQGGEVLGTFTGCSVSGVSFLCEAKLRVYFGGRLVLNGWTGVRPDRLGSPDGTHGRVYPYGEVSGSVSVDQDETFTTYKRDVYTGLDYAQNRYYASAWGRFTTADPYRASGGPANPQSWNRYAYVEGDPVNFGDPAGTNKSAPDSPDVINGCMKSQTTWDELACRQNGGQQESGGGGSFFDPTAILPAALKDALGAYEQNVSSIFDTWSKSVQAKEATPSVEVKILDSDGNVHYDTDQDPSAYKNYISGYFVSYNIPLMAWAGVTVGATVLPVEHQIGLSAGGYIGTQGASLGAYIFTNANTLPDVISGWGFTGAGQAPMLGATLTGGLNHQMATALTVGSPGASYSITYTWMFSMESILNP
jgi:RHS repeat-associated protein